MSIGFRELLNAIGHRLRGSARPGLGCWRYAISAKWLQQNSIRRSFASISTVRKKFSTGCSRLTQEFISQFRGIAVTGVIWLFWGLFDASSKWFLFELLCVGVFAISLGLRRHLIALTSVCVFLMTLGTLAFTATYQIASDQFRFHYKSLKDASYFEFPARVRFLDFIASSFARDRIIRVSQCGDTKVALLPVLPYTPLFASQADIDKIGFRRLPDIQTKYFDLNITPLIDAPSSTAPHGGFGLKLKFGDGNKDISPTTLFPRSLDCMSHNVPLLPILEVLPWSPSDLDSLVSAAERITAFRKLLFHEPVSLKRLLQFRTNDSVDIDADTPLIDFVSYSLTYQMFDGNAFTELRAHLGNTLCTLIDRNPTLFSGPFLALAQNLVRQIASEFGPNARVAAPACHISEKMAQAFKDMSRTSPQLPFYATFEKCLAAKSSIAKCLAADDAPLPRPPCEGIPCVAPKSLNLPDEMALEDYDKANFSDVVAKKGNGLIDIASVQPSVCPDLRDRQETKHFVDWWMAHAREIVSEATSCSSRSLEQYSHRREELRAALQCADKRGVKGSQYDEGGVEILDEWRAAKCSGAVNISDETFNQMYEFFNQLDPLIDQIDEYSMLTNDKNVAQFVRALKMLDGIEQDVCDHRSIKDCAQYYRVWHDQKRLVNKISNDLNLSSISTARSLVDALSKLNNIFVNIGVCDALQDAQFSKAVGYDRGTYCDAHGLARYRQISSTPVGHSAEKIEDRAGILYGYEYESNGRDSEFTINKFVDDK